MQSLLLWLLLMLYTRPVAGTYNKCKHKANNQSRNKSRINGKASSCHYSTTQDTCNSATSLIGNQLQIIFFTGREDAWPSHIIIMKFQKHALGVIQLLLAVTVKCDFYIIFAERQRSASINSCTLILPSDTS